MSFWDNVKKFAQPYADEDYDDYDDEEMDEFEEEEEVAPRPARRAPAFSTASGIQPVPQRTAPEIPRSGKRISIVRTRKEPIEWPNST